MNDDLIKQINAILPQTQCTRCGYPSCLEYATAIAQGNAKINQCPPGGDVGIAKLAELLQLEVLPLNPENGIIKPRQIAVIDEAACIGCTLCIKACPVDAIIGSNKMMHTVIESECTGCDLCLPVCPVDCIEMIDSANQEWGQAEQEHAKSRFEWRNLRKIRDINARNKRLLQHEVQQTTKNTLLAEIMAKVGTTEP
jgi:electron transport complex protein RnfB